MIRPKPSLFILCALLLACGCSNVVVGPGWTGEKVKGEGFAPYNKANPVDMRAGALAAAQRNAVEKVVGVFVSGQTLVRKSMVIDQKILSRTSGFIKNYKVIGEGRQGDLYRVEIKALVLVRELNSALDELELENPAYNKKITVLCSDTGRDLCRDVRAGVFAEFEKSGFSLVDSSGVADIGDTRAALDAGRQAGADFVITAKSDTYPIEGMPGLAGAFISMRAKSGMKVLEVSSGRVVNEVSNEASSIDAVKEIAERKAASAAAGLSAAALLESVKKASVSGTVITLKIDGMASIEDVSKVKTILDAAPGVDSYTLDHYVHGDVAFSVRVNGVSGEELASCILRQLPYKMMLVTQYEIELSAD